MATRNVAGFDDIPQGLIFYAASCGFALVFLFGIGACIVGLSGTYIAYIAVGAGLWISLGTTYHVHKGRLRSRAAKVD